MIVVSRLADQWVGKDTYDGIPMLLRTYVTSLARSCALYDRYGVAGLGENDPKKAGPSSAASRKKD